ncbi:hypothetical protein ACFVTY_29875 [Streptomyces sp. NPDC058067]|uniref:hypothetical protein n=1 Tax=Streptomyces sp. NPDC058067 TaxID=3346324 RepID=UPI0036EE10A2
MGLLGAMQRGLRPPLASRSVGQVDGLLDLVVRRVGDVTDLDLGGRVDHRAPVRGDALQRSTADEQGSAEPVELFLRIHRDSSRRDGT